MQTYKYRFPAIGQLDPYSATEYLDMLESSLKDSPDCLMSYCIFPSDSDILDHVELDMDRDGYISGIELHTYTRLWDGMENDLKNCMKENLAAMAEEFDEEIGEDICLEGPVQALGREGDIPKTLYHITDRKNLDAILTEGLVPDIGANNYKNMEPYVHLAEKDSVAPWMAILKHVDDPVILQIDTEDLEGFETGRIFTDREFTKPDGYGEWRTAEAVPASNIQEAELTDAFKADLLSQTLTQINRAISVDEKAETMTGAVRLMQMGITDDSLKNLLAQQQKTENSQSALLEDDSPPWDTSDGKTKVIPAGKTWADMISGDFANAIDGICVSDADHKMEQ